MRIICFKVELLFVLVFYMFDHIITPPPFQFQVESKDEVVSKQ